MTITTTTPLTKDEFKATVSQFKATVNSNDAKPTYDSYGTKFQGCVRFEHFAFYALLRGKSLTSVTHDSDSERFIELKASLKRAVDNNGAYFECNNLLPSLSGVFDLTHDQIKAVINHGLS